MPCAGNLMNHKFFFKMGAPKRKETMTFFGTCEPPSANIELSKSTGQSTFEVLYYLYNYFFQKKYVK